MVKDVNIVYRMKGHNWPFNLALRYPIKFFFLIFTVYPCLILSSESLDEIYFNVYRNGAKIGYHKVEFNNSESSLKANIEIKFEVTFLGFTVYDYYHQNTEIWKKNTLNQLNSITDKNGEELFCNFKKINDTFNLKGSVDSFKPNKDFIPTSYWNHKLVEGPTYKTVLNTQDCSSIKFKIENLGNDTIYDAQLPATHYKLTGREWTGEDVDIDIWYNNNKWVKMIYIKDGSKIEYFLKGYDIENE